MPPALGRYAVLVGLGILLVLLAVRSPSDPLDNPAFDALSRAHSRKMAAQAVALDSARTQVVHDTVRVAFAVHEYRTLRDSLRITDTVQVKVFVAKADSVVRSCTALVESCALFRVRAESSLAGLTLDRDVWKAVAESRKPSRWSRVQEWGIRLGIGYVAFKVGQGSR